jgi:hypothetical protein
METWTTIDYVCELINGEISYDYIDSYTFSEEDFFDVATLLHTQDVKGTYVTGFE